MGPAIVLASLAAAAPAPPAQVATPQAHCLEARMPVIENAIPSRANFRRVVCPAHAIAPAFRYDRARGCTRTIRTIAQGEIVPAYPEFARRMIEPGQSLKLVISDGAVRVERTVKAMQAAGSGQKLFVKTADGQILSVRYESRTP